MSSYKTLNSTRFDSNVSLNTLQCDLADHGDHGAFHKMLKYWRNSSKSAVSLRKSASFLEYRDLDDAVVGGCGVRSMLSGGRDKCSISYKRLESFDETKLKKMRQHTFMAGTQKGGGGGGAGGGAGGGGGSSASHSPEKLRGATQDLFELLERVQCSRLDDQRCVLPAYFSQVSKCTYTYTFSD
uniref:Uncharacterized protein n=1 Tax=Ceratitis capitata TaxID=7213 RepID=W8AUM6_CERCA